IIRSRKAMTFKADRVARYKKNTRSRFLEHASGAEKAARAQTENSEIKNAAVQGNYTIQIASYRALEDAAEQVAYLKSKGFAVYRSMGRIDNTVWHRVRTGAFESRRAAEKKLVKLKQQDLDGIIIKKE
ncbi:MAG: SPOR domain-containing protein, partial [Thermodesulfobacteriota bacterium]|nr:SPOR domain-containing protein [Thermodesulfobacteriota bacterium]